MTLGARIKAQRQSARLSQEKVAELVGVSRQAVTKWESDQSAPSTENLLKLAQLLGCSLDQLVRDDTPPVPETPRRRRVDVRRNFRDTLIFLGVYLVWFLLCKLIWADLGDQTILSWLLDDAPLYHDYLFGWMIGFYLPCTLVAVVPALFGKRRFSAVYTAGFVLALPLGEYLGCISALVDPGYHYGWAIWLGVNLDAVIFGILLQRFPDGELRRDSKKFRAWCIGAAVSLLAVIGFVLLNIPRHSWN